MQVFVAEYVCSGAWCDGPLDGSLANEGRSMLLAACADFAKIPGVHVVTTWDRRLGPFPLSGVEAIVCSSTNKEREEFDRLARTSDAVFLIAPEFAEHLADRRRRVDSLGIRCLNGNVSAIELCADKLRLAEHLESHGIPTIRATTLRPGDAAPATFPLVVKPRFGAGSLDIFRVGSSGELDSAERYFQQLSANGGLPAGEPIIQSCIDGRAMSVAALVDSSSGRVEIFPPAEQFLSSDGRFRYLGGRVQAGASLPPRHRDTIQRACAAVPGLCGYVGFDLLFPGDEPGAMLVVEINPRLTTSYLGYRVLTEENLMQRLLRSDELLRPIAWEDRAARFTPDGTVTFEDC